MTTLPDKPSALIRLAIADLEKCEASPNYVIDMDVWHGPCAAGSTPCHVCLAGAVMAGSLGYPAREDVCPSDTEHTPKMEALDGLRIGEWGPALATLDIAPEKTPDGLTMFSPTPYKDDPAAFKADMLRAADIFEEAGL